MNVEPPALYHALSSREENYTYWYTPKCACTTTKTLLWEIEAGLGRCPPLDGTTYVHQRQHDADSPWCNSHATIVASLDAPDRYMFTFVRNPYARSLSAYESVATTPDSHAFFTSFGWDRTEVPTYMEFLEILTRQDPASMNHHWQPLTSVLPFREIAFRHVGCVERYPEDWAVVAAHAFATPVVPDGARSMNRTGAGERVASLDPSARALIRRIYAHDFELFGYRDDPLSQEPDAAKLAALARG
ncbi:hypothetical protein OPKNFCMD_2933 [Methylobacterium crusticola]|uniref:Sulfotransferase family protein n=1 Tax=Methylobacterium crusticola TaxID=1697972 RepID=A0ABQ4QZZ7_9HYPH|nr:sulfotransferase family 2 domain-containing protein [Methylobacterium crusticola]GJD50196.1 hypothetical protein OPKNFCMD_2933 [Methylobacterium crusticola]